MPKCRVGSDEIYYETLGAGTPLLLVPGLGGAGTYWNPNRDGLSKNHLVVIHDHRGTGQSTHARIRYSVDQMADDMLAVMDDLKLEKAHLVGHSTGGAIVQTAAARWPDRLKSIVIYGSWTKADPFFDRTFEARRTLLMAGGLEAYVRSNPIFLYPDWWLNANIASLEQREKVILANSPPAEIIASRIDAILAFDRTADLPKVTTPTLVLCAKDDILTPPYFSRELARLIPGAELVEMEKGGHFVSEVDADGFNKVVLDFIGRHE